MALQFDYIGLNANSPNWMGRGTDSMDSAKPGWIKSVLSSSGTTSILSTSLPARIEFLAVYGRALSTVNHNIQIQVRNYGDQYLSRTGQTQNYFYFRERFANESQPLIAITGRNPIWLHPSHNGNATLQIYRDSTSANLVVYCYYTLFQ